MASSGSQLGVCRNSGGTFEACLVVVLTSPVILVQKIERFDSFYKTLAGWYVLVLAMESK